MVEAATTASSDSAGANGFEAKVDYDYFSPHVKVKKFLEDETKVNYDDTVYTAAAASTSSVTSPVRKTVKDDDKYQNSDSNGSEAGSSSGKNPSDDETNYPPGVPPRQRLPKMKPKKRPKLFKPVAVAGKPFDEKGNRSEEFKEWLRQKFIRQCEKYLGVPYAKRYRKKGDPLYSAPLFLDCCALVRRAVNDLRKEFGFKLGPGNQCYQFDTCPIDLQKEEMRPGDLIFYSAKYDNPKTIIKHDMVHIEVFLGGKSGEKSIGSRTSIGQVSYHDSYKFVGRKYHSIQYHYKSLDTYLDGICKSWCPEHKWRRSNYSVSDGNNHKLVIKWLRRRGLEPITEGMRVATKTPRFRWTNKPSEITSWKSFVEGKHVVNHFSNSAILTNRLKLLKLFKKLQEAMKKRRIVSEFFPSASSFLLESYCLEKNTQLTAFLALSNSGQWVLKNTSAIDNGDNSITYISDIGAYKKAMLLKVRRGPREKLQAIVASNKPHVSDFEADDTSDEETKTPMRTPQRSSSKAASATPFRTPAKSTALRRGTSKIKTPAMIRRRPLKVGVFDRIVVQRYLDKPALFEGRKFDIRAFMIILCGKPWFVMAHHGYARVCLKKFTMTNFGKAQVSETTGKLNTSSQRMIHEADQSVQRKHPDYLSLKQSTTITLETLKQHFLEQGVLENEAEFQTRIIDKMYEVMRLLFLMVKDKLEKRFGCFEIFGLDFLLGADDLNPKLMDITSCPSFSTDMEESQGIIRTLIRDVVTMTQELHEKNREMARECRLEQVSKCGKLSYVTIYREPGDRSAN